MNDIIVIADDLTGAGDVAVQFRYFFENIYIFNDLSDKSDEFSIYNTETRNSDEKHIRNVYASLEKSIRDKDIVFKKIDSTLRGNIKLEMKCIKEKFNDAVFFLVPAFPEMKRTTKDGIHYVDNVTIDKTEYFQGIKKGNRSKYLKEFIPSDKIQQVNPEKISLAQKHSDFYIFDCWKDEHFHEISKFITENFKDRKKVIFSSAGIARYLCISKNISSLDFSNDLNINDKNMLFIVGSYNSVNRKYFSDKNFEKIGIDIKEIMNGNFRKEKIITKIIDKSKKNKRIFLYIKDNKFDKRLTQEIDNIFIDIFKDVYKFFGVFVLSGGTTAYNLLNNIGKKRFKVENVVETGIPSLSSEDSSIIIKPGGFGSADLLDRLIK